MLTEEQQKLVTDNHNLIYAFLRKKNFSIEDYYDLAAIGLCQAAKSFDPNFGYSFSTYAFKSMLNYCATRGIKHDNRQSAIPKNLILSGNMLYSNPDDSDQIEFFDLIPGSPGIEEEIITKELLKNHLSTMKEKKRKIIEMYLSGMTFKKIAAEIHNSRAYVGSVVKEFKEKFRKEMFKEE